MRKTILAAVLPLTLLAASGAHAAENDFFSGKRYCEATTEFVLKTGAEFSYMCGGKLGRLA